MFRFVILWVPSDYRLLHYLYYETEVVHFIKIIRFSISSFFFSSCISNKPCANINAVFFSFTWVLASLAFVMNFVVQTGKRIFLNEYSALLLNVHVCKLQYNANYNNSEASCLMYCVLNAVSVYRSTRAAFNNRRVRIRTMTVSVGEEVECMLDMPWNLPIQLCSFFSSSNYFFPWMKERQEPEIVTTSSVL